MLFIGILSISIFILYKSFYYFAKKYHKEMTVYDQLKTLAWVKIDNYNYTTSCNKFMIQIRYASLGEDSWLVYHLLKENESEPCYTTSSYWMDAVIDWQGNFDSLRKICQEIDKTELLEKETSQVKILD